MIDQAPDRLDAAIDRVAARIVTPGTDPAQLDRILAMLPERPSLVTFVLHTLVPQVAVVASVALVATIWIGRGREASPPVIQQVADARPIVVQRATADRPVVAAGVAANPRGSQSPQRRLSADHDRHLTPLASLDELSVAAMESRPLMESGPIDVTPGSIAPIVLSDLATIGDALSPPFKE